MLIYTAIYVPFQVAFLTAYDQVRVMDDIDEFVNIMFQIDFCLNFITAVEVNGRLEYHLG